MPEISRFLGTIISMNYNDHAPPHFHARYGSDEIIVELDTLRVIGGRFSPRALGLVIEWATQYGDELRENWLLARESAPLKRIQPLT